MASLRSFRFMHVSVSVTKDTPSKQAQCQNSRTHVVLQVIAGVARGRELHTEGARTLELLQYGKLSDTQWARLH